jgi:hypothetical protein
MEQVLYCDLKRPVRDFFKPKRHVYVEMEVVSDSLHSKDAAVT